MLKLMSALIAMASVTVPAGAQPPVLTDAQVAAAVLAVNRIDIEAGALAQQKALAPDVKAHGEQALHAQRNMGSAAVDLTAKLALIPEDSPLRQRLKHDGEQNVNRLKQLVGSDFDRAYLDYAVDYRESVLDTIDKTLIPNAMSNSLRELLTQSARPAFADQLAHARQLRQLLDTHR